MMAVLWTRQALNPVRRQRRSLGRALLTAASREVGLADISVTRSPMSKPLLNIPGWQYSVSYSGPIAVCALAEGPVGIDVETLTRVGRPRRDPAVPQRFFTEIERQAIAREPTAFLEIFTFKEAWVKYLGVGLGAGLGGFDRENVEARHDEVAIAKVDIPGAVCTVCFPAGKTFVARRVDVSSAEMLTASTINETEREKCFT